MDLAVKKVVEDEDFKVEKLLEWVAGHDDNMKTSRTRSALLRRQSVYGEHQTNLRTTNLLMT